jgi:probable HAF family extracellular repeat protein
MCSINGYSYNVLQVAQRLFTAQKMHKYYDNSLVQPRRTAKPPTPANSSFSPSPVEDPLYPHISFRKRYRLDLEHPTYFVEVSMKKHLLFWIASIFLIFSFSSAYAVTYSVVDLGTPGIISYGYGINDSGMVTGISYPSGGGQTHAFVHDGTTMKDLGTLGGGSSYSYDINNSGKVTGWSYTSSNQQRAFIYDETGMQDLGTLGGISSYGRSINNYNVVTGDSTTLSGQTHAFVYDETGMHDIGTLGGSFSYGLSINDSGMVTGRSSVSGGEHAFVHDGTSMQDLGTLGGSFSSGQDINNLGMVTGTSTISNGQWRAFFHDGKSMINLGTLGGSDSFGLSINDSGWIVGMSITSLGAQRAFLYFDDVMHDLNDLLMEGHGWYLTTAYSINNLGQITGVGTIKGQVHAFLATPIAPVPIPGAALLLGSSLLGIVGLRRRLAA